MPHVKYTQKRNAVPMAQNPNRSLIHNHIHTQFHIELPKSFRKVTLMLYVP
jgi:hypothetical protein